VSRFLPNVVQGFEAVEPGGLQYAVLEPSWLSPCRKGRSLAEVAKRDNVMAEA
jgi:hypothetical protein